MVVARHGTGSVTRQGRGFSAGELLGAGLDRMLASGWGLRVDTRRRSVLESNVESLKHWGSRTAREKRGEGRVKRAEEQLVTIERGVKREAVVVEKKIAKAEKGVKKEAVKAEKAVRKKARPKAKPKKKPSD
jgi:hypothetical protein